DGRYALGVLDAAVPITPRSFHHVSRLIPAAKALWPMIEFGCSPGDFWHELWASSHWPLDRPSPFEACRVLVPAFNTPPMERGLTELRRHFPVFSQARILERWSGVLSCAPDNMPIISAVPGYSGLYTGTGFVNGLTMGPAAGEALADLATGRKPR